MDGGPDDVLTWRGKVLEGLTRAELEEAVRWLAEELRVTRERLRGTGRKRVPDAVRAAVGRPPRETAVLAAARAVLVAYQVQLVSRTVDIGNVLHRQAIALAALSRATEAYDAKEGRDG